VLMDDMYESNYGYYGGYRRGRYPYGKQQQKKQVKKAVARNPKHAKSDLHQVLMDDMYESNYGYYGGYRRGRYSYSKRNEEDPDRSLVSKNVAGKFTLH